MKLALIGLALALVRGSTQVQINPVLAPLSFLVGDWMSSDGKVADTGLRSTGSSQIRIAANGGMLLREDRTNLFEPGGKAMGSFDQVMIIYPEAGVLRSDYSDGRHVIHYRSAVVTPGRSVTFLTGVDADGPAYKLNYTLTAPDTLAVTFSMALRAGSQFQTVATGTLSRAD